MITSTLPTGTPTSNLPPSASSSNNNSGSAASSAAAGLTQNFDTFLTLLTTQLKNQDPLSPLDTNQFTQQLVSFSEVEQAINTNKNLTTLIQLQSANETIGALPLIGRSIEYSDATGPLAGGTAAFSYTLPSSAAQASVVVQDAQGNTVYSGAADPSAGRHAFAWDGRTSAGRQLPDGGLYTLKVLATSATGTPISATVTATGKVDNVSTVNGQATFNVGGYGVPMSKLVTVVNPS
jgi:flagellar basal-body rod modification protein FlgD